MMDSVWALLDEAVAAKAALAYLGAAQRVAALQHMAAGLRQSTAEILAANQADMKNAKGRIADVMLDRLWLDEGRVNAMAEGMLAVSRLESPVGQLESCYQHPNGMRIQKLRVPMGVVAIIYESRPNVTSDAVALCLQSGNACVLRGGSDAINTNKAIVKALKAALAGTDVPPGCVQLVEDTSHESAAALMQARGYVDLLIPRGGTGLIRAVVEGARGVPVIETGTGICHVYVDKAANPSMALDILYNAKTSRPSVCNSAEVCLVHKDIAPAFLPLLAKRMDGSNGIQVQLRLDEAAAKTIAGAAAGPQDFDTEFLDYILAVAVVDSVDEAIRHINLHGTHHSDAIITGDEAAAARFMAGVDSAAVYHNASTRFTDGGEFGLGCEMGISTQKLGARGPMGLYQLTSYKYQIEGHGDIR